MSKAAISVFAFGVYLLVMGTALILAPNSILSLFRIPATTEIWIRVLGTTVVILGMYYIVAARVEDEAFFRATVVVRPVVLLAFLGFVVFAGAPPALMLFAAADIVCATWTAWALRARTVMLLVAALSIAPAHTVRAQTLVVLNKSEQSASLIDAATGRTITKLPVGRGPHELALSPDGRTAYVANFGRFGVYSAGDTLHTRASNTVTVLDLAGHTVKRTYDFGTHTGQHGVAVSRDGKRVWLTSETPNALLEMDPATGKILSVWPTQQERTHLVVPSPDEKTFYVTNTVSGSLTVIDRATGSAKTIPIGPGAEGLTVSPDGKEVWVARRNDSKICVVSTASGTIVDTFDAGGEGPQRIQFTPDGKQVWASNVRSNTLTVFDAQSRKLIGSVSVGAGPAGIVFSRDGRRGYFALSGANQIAVIDVAAKKVIQTFATGLEPDGIALSPR